MDHVEWAADPEGTAGSGDPCAWRRLSNTDGPYDLRNATCVEGDGCVDREGGVLGRFDVCRVHGTVDRSLGVDDAVEPCNSPVSSIPDDCVYATRYHGDGLVRAVGGTT